jgi:hypothetical protein
MSPWAKLDFLMLDYEDYSDDRHKAWCIHCGEGIGSVLVNRDHVPTKSLLSKAVRLRGADYDRGADDPYGYLPQVIVCKQCNSGFSPDENYLLCVLHAVTSGSLYPDPECHPEAATVLRSNRHVVKMLKQPPDGQLSLFPNLPPFSVYPDVQRVERVILKNARGHAFHEISEAMLSPPEYVGFVPLQQMDADQRQAFECAAGGQGFSPEVGSRMLNRLVVGEGLDGPWLEVEAGRYRYCVDWGDGVTVRTVIWEYLATETRWVDGD